MVRGRWERYGTLMAFGALLTALLACKRAKNESTGGEATAAADTPAAPVVPVGPVTLNWEQSYKVTAQGVTGEGTFFPTKEADKPPLKLRASFSQFPKGTKIKIGSEEGTAGDTGYFSTLVDIKPAVIQHSLEDLKGPVDLDLDLTISVPGAAPVTTKLQKQDVKEGVRFALLKARDSGMSFGGADEAAAKPRGAAVLSGYSDLEFLGTAKNLLEVDWVAIAEDQAEPRATKSCKFKEGPATLKMYDANVIIVERRTANKIAETVIQAKDECPMFAFIDKSDNSTKNKVDQKNVVAWVRGELAKGTK